MTEAGPEFVRRPVLVCFSHLRWNFVFQRPQHLMSRFAREYRVFFWEEPTFEADLEEACLERADGGFGVTVLTPRLPEGLAPGRIEACLESLLRACPEFAEPGLVRWYYTP